MYPLFKKNIWYDTSHPNLAWSLSIYWLEREENLKE
jgi:hypothetical protein